MADNDSNNYDNYDNLAQVNNIDDILMLINHKWSWGLANPSEVANRVEYNYGCGKKGLIQALYNLAI